MRADHHSTRSRGHRTQGQAGSALLRPVIWHPELTCLTVSECFEYISEINTEMEQAGKQPTWILWEALLAVFFRRTGEYDYQPWAPWGNSPAGADDGDADSDDSDDNENYEEGHGRQCWRNWKAFSAPCKTWIKQTPCRLCAVVVVESLSAVQLFWPARLLCLWDFPDKNTDVGCYFLLQLPP